MDESTIRGAVNEVFGGAAGMEIIGLPPDRFAVTLHTDGHTATMDGSEESGWGWTVDPGEDEGFSGHGDTSPTLAEALLAIRAAMGVGAA
jgi:hypothetical protein